MQKSHDTTPPFTSWEAVTLIRRFALKTSDLEGIPAVREVENCSYLYIVKIALNPLALSRCLFFSLPIPKEFGTNYIATGLERRRPQNIIDK